VRLSRAWLPAVLALLLGGTSALAYLQGNLRDVGFGDFGLYVFNANLVLRLEQDASFRITDGSDLTALTDSMARWTNVATSKVTITEGTRFNLASPIDAGAGLGSDGFNRVFFAETDNQNRIGQAIAVAFFFVSGDGRITDCDIVLNERVYTFSTTTPANPNQFLGSSTYDLGEIATHEMGHCIGLDHSAVAGRFSATTGLQVSGFTSGDFTHQATLYPYGSRTIQGRSLSPDDVAGASFIYPDLASTSATITGRILDGGDFTPVVGAHVVAVSTSAPDIPIVGSHSDLQEGGPGGEYTLPALPPGSYYVRIEPLLNTSNPFSAANTHFDAFDTDFPWEYYNGTGETGFDAGTDRTAISVTAGQTISGIDILTNVGAPDPNEPNDTRAAATPAACEQRVPASIAPRGDIDYYAMNVTSPTTLLVDVSAGRAGSSLDPIAAVFDAAGNRLAFADNTVSVDPIFSVDLFAAGTYYVAVASFNDSGFNGTDARTVGSYTLTLGCSVPEVRAGTCAGRVLYAGSNQGGRIYAISDADRSLTFEGQTVFTENAGTQLGAIATRRDGGVCVGMQSGDILGFWDDTGDFAAERGSATWSGVADAQSIAALRRSGAEHLYAADLQGGGSVVEQVDTDGDFLADRINLFTADPESVLSLTVDEAGTVFVLDSGYNGGLGAIRSFQDLNGDGVADRSHLFLDGAPSYAIIAARRPGEVYATDIFQGQIDRIRDTDGDGLADSVNPYASGLLLDVRFGMTFDDADVLYTVDSGVRILALPDDDGDGDADRQVQFSPLIDSLTGISFGPGPPEAVSPPGSYAPITVTRSGSGLRLTWEDQGPTVPAYNIYEGTLGTPNSHAPLACHVAGTSDGTGSRFMDLTPGAGDRYYLVTASDACGEGSAGRGSDGCRRSLPPGACGPMP
jgi:hypothetical protein